MSSAHKSSVSPAIVPPSDEGSGRRSPRTRQSPKTLSCITMDYSVTDVCGWRKDLESDNRGEFWIDREALTQRMSKLSPTQRAFFRWAIIEEFSTGLEQILLHDQAVGEMREDFRDR